MDSTSLIQTSTRLLSSVGSPCKTALHFVAIRKPQNQLLRHAVTLARLTYVAGVIVGLAAIWSDATGEKREINFKHLTAVVLGNLFPYVGLLYGYLQFKDTN